MQEEVTYSKNVNINDLKLPNDYTLITVMIIIRYN